MCYVNVSCLWWWWWWWWWCKVEWIQIKQFIPMGVSFIQSGVNPNEASFWKNPTGISYLCLPCSWLWRRGFPHKVAYCLGFCCCCFIYNQKAFCITFCVFLTKWNNFMKHFTSKTKQFIRYVDFIFRPDINTKVIKTYLGLSGALLVCTWYIHTPYITWNICF